VRTSWTIQPGQRLTTRPERNFEHKEVTNCAEPEQRQMIGRNASEGMEPRKRFLLHRARGSFYPEASIAACDYGEWVCDEPGPEAIYEQDFLDCSTGFGRGEVVTKPWR
jgi:hypothetical protein